MSKLKGFFHDLLKISISDFDHAITFPDQCTANMMEHTYQGLCGHSPSHPFLQFEQVAAPVESSCKVHD